MRNADFGTDVAERRSQIGTWALIAWPTVGPRGLRAEALPEGDARSKGEIQVMKLHTRRGGFTLIELMIVVAIIGILAAIAIPNFLRFQLKAKSSEGKTNLAAIRTAEESYFAEYGNYVSADPSPPTGSMAPFNQKTIYSDAFADLGFDIIGWEPEGMVFFNYSVEINAAADEFTAGSGADIDNDGTPQVWGYRKGALDGKDHVALGQCTAAGIGASEVVKACDLVSGNSVF
jgi:type IV pilus assembly protein PilA